MTAAGIPASRPVPYRCHLLVCTNHRDDGRPSCGGDALCARLKEEVAARGWRDRVRVSRTGCLGLCADGPNVICYPHGAWFTGVGLDDVAGILAAVEAMVQEPPCARVDEG